MTAGELQALDGVAPHGSWGLIPTEASCVADSRERYDSVEENMF